MRLGDDENVHTHRGAIILCAIITLKRILFERFISYACSSFKDVQTP